MPVKINNLEQTINIISPLTDNDINEIIVITDNLFGSNYLTKQELQNYINNVNKIGIVAKNDSEIIGFQLLQIDTPDNILKTILREKDWFRKQFSKHQLIGVLKTLAVKEKYHNQGIGTLLTKKSLDIFKKKADLIISVCWDKNRNNSISKILEKFNIALVHEIKEYWKNDSIKNNYSCKICGSPPCRCNALIHQYQESY